MSDRRGSSKARRCMFIANLNYDWLRSFEKHKMTLIWLPPKRLLSVLNNLRKLVLISSRLGINLFNLFIANSIPTRTLLGATPIGCIKKIKFAWRLPKSIHGMIYFYIHSSYWIFLMNSQTVWRNYDIVGIIALGLNA